MLGRVLDTIAPEPSLFAKFEYNWKHIKSYYQNQLPRQTKQVDETNIPFYLEELLSILIKEEQLADHQCMDFVLENNILELLADIAIEDNPVGIRSLILGWMRKYLTCLSPKVANDKLFTVFKSILKLQTVCKGANASAYEKNEILFLEAVTGTIVKNPEYLRYLLPRNHHRDSTMKEILNMKPPRDNFLFKPAKLEPNIRRISLMVNDDEEADEKVEEGQQSSKSTITPKKLVKKCDCDEYARFYLFHAILGYLESADSEVVVRACEAVLILVSLKQLKDQCVSVEIAYLELSHIISDKLSDCAELIPTMDLSDIEDCTVSWGLYPKDDASQYVGKYQLTSFLCWLDFADSLAKDNLLVADILGELFRVNTLEKIVEPNLFELCPSFGLALTTKIVKQLRSESLMEEIASWLVGTEINGTDCMLNILIENVQDNHDLIQILQLVEALLDNPNERILHSMLFIYVNNRGYFDFTKVTDIEAFDEEDQGKNPHAALKSRTMAPNNILKVINNFLLLLPRQLMAESIGTCYEEYLHDASRHYKIWIEKTSKFHWPIEATTYQRRTPTKSPLISSANNFSDSGIAEEYVFYEGPLLRLLFNRIRNMANQPYEINLATIAVLSKLALLPHPYLHEVLLGTDTPASGASTLYTVIQALSVELLAEIPRRKDFHTKIRDTAKRLLSNQPLTTKADGEERSEDETDYVFEALICLEEFVKELAAISFVKFHHGTE